MKRLLVLSLFLLPTTSFGQTQCVKCDIGTIVQISTHRDSLTYELIRDFLCSIDQTCKNDAEYSAASNGTIFDLIDIATSSFFHVLEFEDVEVKLILKELENPIHEIIDLQMCYDRVEQMNINQKYRSEVLKAIEIGAIRGGQELKKEINEKVEVRYKYKEKEEYPGDFDFYINTSSYGLRVRTDNNAIDDAYLTVSDNYGKIHYQGKLVERDFYLNTLQKGQYRLKIDYDGKHIKRMIEIYYNR